jgi:hypothetical protein
LGDGFGFDVSGRPAELCLRGSGHRDQEPTWLQTLEVIVWPLLILVILGLLLLTPSGAALMRTVFARIRGVEALGVKLDFTEASATKVRESLEETFHRYRQDSQHEFDRLERMYDINFYRTEVLSKCVLPHIAEEVKNDFRCTIHVQDLLFEESLYQLLDYIPSGGGRGRAFPVRFGILGKTWRSQKSQGQGTVPTDAERLIVDWGMTPDEALGAGRGRQSFACAFLRSAENAPLGVFYVDSMQRNAFGTSQEEREVFLDGIEEGAKTWGLIVQLESLIKDTRRGAPGVRVFDQA